MKRKNNKIWEIIKQELFQRDIHFSVTGSLQKHMLDPYEIMRVYQEVLKRSDSSVKAKKSGLEG